MTNLLFSNSLQTGKMRKPRIGQHQVQSCRVVLAARFQKAHWYRGALRTGTNLAAGARSRLKPPAPLADGGRQFGLSQEARNVGNWLKASHHDATMHCFASMDRPTIAQTTPCQAQRVLLLWPRVSRRRARAAREADVSEADVSGDGCLDGTCWSRACLVADNGQAGRWCLCWCLWRDAAQPPTGFAAARV